MATGGTFFNMASGNECQITRPASRPAQDRVQPALNLSRGGNLRDGLRELGEGVLIYTLFTAATLANALIIAEFMRAFG